jgi:hypothetical protein
LPEIFAGFGKIGKSIPGLLRQDRFRAMVTCTITAWERWVIFPSDCTDRLFLNYKNGSVEVSSLVSRLKLQQDNMIGLYSHDYESKEKLLCIDTAQPETEHASDLLPLGFKKTDSWILIDPDAEQEPHVFTQDLESFNRDTREFQEINRHPKDIDGEIDRHPEDIDEESDEDIDGEPLNLISQKEESEEDIDGEPLFRFN